jgi:hypothetical protein
MSKKPVERASFPFSARPMHYPPLDAPDFDTREPTVGEEVAAFRFKSHEIRFVKNGWRDILTRPQLAIFHQGCRIDPDAPSSALTIDAEYELVEEDPPEPSRASGLLSIRLPQTRSRPSRGSS